MGEASRQFMESVDYLRQLGALDESDPTRLRVIVPNYLIGPNNCLEASPMHTYCCKDECGELMAEVERGVAAPMAAPGSIVKIVSQLSTDTVDAPRNLTVELTGKLEAVASRHGGRVPVHGRLFAQWMHRAFPNECPHPHVSGTTAPKTTVEFQKSGGNATVSDEERTHHIAAQAPLWRSAAGETEDLAWSDEEELLSYDDPNSQALWAARIFRSFAMLASLMLVAALLSMTVGGARAGSVTLGGRKRTSQVSEKYVV